MTSLLSQQRDPFIHIDTTEMNAMTICVMNILLARLLIITSTADM